jgi:hypothetical protein
MGGGDRVEGMGLGAAMWEGGDVVAIERMRWRKGIAESVS